MASIRIMQGDTYPIYLSVKQDGTVLTPSLISDMEVCIGDGLRKTYIGGGVQFDSNLQKWYVIPTQRETYALYPGTNEVVVRIKYYGSKQFVKGKKAGIITVVETKSQEII